MWMTSVCNTKDEILQYFTELDLLKDSRHGTPARHRSDPESGDGMWDAVP